MKENRNNIKQITGFKAILVRRINIRGCEDYKNTFARMECDYPLRFAFKTLIKSISYTKQSNLFLHLLSTSQNGSLVNSREYLPLDETIQLLANGAFTNNWFNTTYDLNFSKTDFVDLLSVATKRQLFQFNGALYEQTDGILSWSLTS